MFLQLVTPKVPNPPPTVDSVVKENVDSLFIYHPLQISAIVETAWRNRYNAANMRFVPWPRDVTDPLLRPITQGFDFSTSSPTPIAQADGIMPAGEKFQPPNTQPGISAVPVEAVNAVNWDHLIYAYLIENT